MLGDEHYKYIFNILRRVWAEDIRYQSSATKIIEHPAYQSIIALGEPMIPFIIQEVCNDEAHWFHALRKITGFTPDVGGSYSIANLERAWINWYSEREDATDHGEGALTLSDSQWQSGKFSR